MSSNDIYTHQDYWKTEMKSFDLTLSDNILYYKEFGNFIHQKFLTDGLLKRYVTKPFDVTINYKNIFENGVTDSSIENAFKLAMFKLRWDTDRLCDYEKHTDKIKQLKN